jgi:hypothetical protein
VEKASASILVVDDIKLNTIAAANRVSRVAAIEIADDL